MSLPEITLEVGCTYLVRNQGVCQKSNKPGTRTIIRQLPAGSLYDFEDDQGEFYTKNGWFLKRHRSKYDLVKRIS
ncbi:hypothetical protein ASG33_08260 [Dyadobacter sp. Leaf189]|nr:hypothetical protein ASG33_08260 [Dyadobacter sp. Leaf189]